MSEKPDWEAIQREYESSNIPYTEIAKNHNVSPGTLYSRSRKWNQDSRSRSRKIISRIENQDSGASITPIHVLRPMPSPSPANIVAGANMAANDLIELIEKSKGNMDFADHMKASSAMTQYNKIIINALPDEDEEQEEQEDLSGFTEEETRIYAELQERAKRKA